MGRSSLLVLVLASQGCVYLEGLDGGGDLGLRSLSTLYVDARGLELTDDGAAGLVGMNDTTCAIDTPASRAMPAIPSSSVRLRMKFSP